MSRRPSCASSLTAKTWNAIPTAWTMAASSTRTGNTGTALHGGPRTLDGPAGWDHGPTPCSNSTWSAPLALRSARSIPGTARLVAVATGHHTFSYGAVVTVDPAHGLNSVSGLRLVTPNVKLRKARWPVGRWTGAAYRIQAGLYRSPWALSEQCFLVAYALCEAQVYRHVRRRLDGFGLYLIDVYGTANCCTAIRYSVALRPFRCGRGNGRPIIPTVAKTDETPKRATEAVCYVPDVYDGMPPEVTRGTIKYLRIAQHVPWPYDQVHGTQDYISGNAGSRHLDFKSWAPVRVFGTVPVEPDGSAHFTVPSDVAIYFQALDQRHMEVQRMRSFVSMKAGEVRGCRGCHESQAQSPAIGAGFGLAMSRAPSTPRRRPGARNVRSTTRRWCNRSSIAIAPNAMATALRKGTSI